MKKAFSLLMLLAVISSSLVGCSDDDKDDVNIPKGSIGWIEYDGIRHLVTSIRDHNEYGNDKEDEINSAYFLLRTDEGDVLDVTFSGKGFDIYNHTYNYAVEGDRAEGGYDVWLFDRGDEDESVIATEEGPNGWFKTSGKKGDLTITAEFEVVNDEGDRYLKGGKAKMQLKLKY